MTRRKVLRNVSASVRQRLLNLARKTGEEYNVVLQRYAIERFLFRLGASDQVDQFTLKGATLFHVWAVEKMRPTQDVDLLGFRPQPEAEIRTVMEGICNILCPEDGVFFDPGSIQVSPIRIDEGNGGHRVRLRGSLGRIRLYVQVDIGFGDVITLERQVRNYPTLLDLPAPRLWTYPRETAVAEEFQAMVPRGPKNSRVKDLWDVACLARSFAFDGKTLRTAITETFRRRGMTFGNRRPEALRRDYYLDPRRETLWAHLVHGIEPVANCPARLVDAGEELRCFLGPGHDSLIEERSFTQDWPVGGPWQSGIQVGLGGRGRD